MCMVLAICGPFMHVYKCAVYNCGVAAYDDDNDARFLHLKITTRYGFPNLIKLSVAMFLCLYNPKQIWQDYSFCPQKCQKEKERVCWEKGEKKNE